MAVAHVPYQPPRAKRSSRTLIFVIGAGMAIFAFVASSDGGLFWPPETPSSRRVPAVVALQDIQPRELITASAVTVTLVPATSLPPHSIVRVADLVGETALVTIYKGQILSQNLV